MYKILRVLTFIFSAGLIVESWADGGLFNRNSLIITHASTIYDHFKSARPGLREQLRIFRKAGSSVYFLVDPTTNENGTNSYLRTQTNDATFVSLAGENTIKLMSTSATIAGGYFGLCHFKTSLDVISNNSNIEEIIWPMRAIFIVERDKSGVISYFSHKTLLDEYALHQENFFELLQLHLLARKDTREQLIGLGASFSLHFYLKEKLIGTIGSGRVINVKLLEE